MYSSNQLSNLIKLVSMFFFMSRGYISPNHVTTLGVICVMFNRVCEWPSMLWLFESWNIDTVGISVELWVDWCVSHSCQFSTALSVIYSVGHCCTCTCKVVEMFRHLDLRDTRSCWYELVATGIVRWATWCPWVAGRELRKEVIRPESWWSYYRWVMGGFISAWKSWKVATPVSCSYSSFGRSVRSQAGQPFMEY